MFHLWFYLQLEKAVCILTVFGTVKLDADYLGKVENQLTFTTLKQTLLTLPGVCAEVLQCHQRSHRGPRLEPQPKALVVSSGHMAARTIPT